MRQITTADKLTAHLLVLCLAVGFIAPTGEPSNWSAANPHSNPRISVASTAPDGVTLSRREINNTVRAGNSRHEALKAVVTSIRARFALPNQGVFSGHPRDLVHSGFRVLTSGRSPPFLRV
jgi:hypothetical protein